MNFSGFGTWLDLYTSEDPCWLQESLVSFDVINLMNSNDQNLLLNNFSRNTHLTALSIDPISAEFLIFHHFSELGNSVRSKNSKMVALTGMRSRATPIRFVSSSDLLSDTKVVSLDVPSASDFKNFKEGQLFEDLIPVKSHALHFRDFVLLPHFLLEAFLSLASLDPTQMILMSNAAAESFITLHKENIDFDLAQITNAVSYIQAFIWACQTNEISGPSFSVTNDSSTMNWADSLHRQFIKSMSTTLPSASSAPAPSDSTLFNLSGNMSSLTAALEKQTLVKSSKEKKFDKFSSHKKQMLLNASSCSAMSAATSPSALMSLLFTCSSISHARDELNQHLHLKGCNVDIPMPFVTHLTTLDWVVRGSTDPRKMSFHVLGKNISLNRSNANDSHSNLRHHLKEVHGKGLDDQTIDQLCKFSFSRTESFEELRQQIKLTCHLLGLILGYSSIYASRFLRVCNHIEDKSHMWESQFLNDSLFGLKCIHLLDRYFQLFISECMDSPCISDIDETFFCFDDVISMITHQRFVVNLPPSLSFKPCSPPTKLKNEAKPTKENERCQKNQDPVQDWLLSKETKLTTAFPKECLASRPNFDNSTKCCHRWASKGYCFSTCEQIKSHCSWSKNLRDLHNVWQKSNRRDL